MASHTLSSGISGEDFRSLFNNTVQNGDEIIFIGEQYDFSDLGTSPIVIDKCVKMTGDEFGHPVISGLQSIDLFRLERDVTFQNLKFTKWDDIFNCQNATALALTIDRCAFSTCDDVVKADLGNAGFTSLSVKESVFRNLTHRPINVDDPVKTALIKDNTISTCIGAGIRIYTNNSTQQQRIENVKLIRNDIRHVSTSVAGGDVHGIIVGGLRADILNNRVQDVTNSGDGQNGEGIYTKVLEGNIENNKLIDANGYDSEASITIKGAGLNAQGKYIICSHNHITMSSSWVDNGTRNVNGIEVQANNVIVSHNHLHKLNKGITTYTAEVSNIQIHHNQIYNCSDDAITLFSDGDNLIVSENIIVVDESITLETQSWGIKCLSRNGNRTIIANNQIDIYNPNGGGGGESGGIGIKNSDGNGWDIHENQIRVVTGATGQDGYGMRILGGNLTDVDVRNNRFIEWGSAKQAFNTNLSDSALCSQQIRIGHNPGYDNRGITFATNDKTPSVAGSDGGFYLESYTGATVKNFDGGRDGQPITILGSSGNLAFVHGGTIQLRTGTSQTLAVNTTKTFQRISSVWYEK